MMMLFAFPDNEALADTVAQQAFMPRGKWVMRTFPDGETYIRLLSDVRDQKVVLLCSLDHPDHKFLPLIFAASLLKEYGAQKITLVAPYLGYLRQDVRFQEGEAVTSHIFAKMLSPYIDHLVTIDPHLHRYRSLNEIYATSTTVLHAFDAIALWIQNNVSNPILVGPDEESEQWNKPIAEKLKAPHVVLNKIRKGDTDVEVSRVTIPSTHTPVIIDDIISSGHTMIETIKQLSEPVCVGVHGIFAENAYQKLLDAGARIVVTTNSIQHASNAIDISNLITEALSDTALL